MEKRIGHGWDNTEANAAWAYKIRWTCDEAFELERAFEAARRMEEIVRADSEADEALVDEVDDDVSEYSG